MRTRRRPPHAGDTRPPPPPPVMAPVMVRGSPPHGASPVSWTCTPQPRSLTRSRPLPPRRAPLRTRSIPLLGGTANRTRSGEGSGKRAEEVTRRGRVGGTGSRLTRLRVGVVATGETFKPITCTLRDPVHLHHHPPPRRAEHDPSPAPLRRRHRTTTSITLLLLLLPCSEDIPSEQRPSPSPHRSNPPSARTAFLPSSPSTTTARQASIGNNSRRRLHHRLILSHLLRSRGRVLPSR